MGAEGQRLDRKGEVIGLGPDKPVRSRAATVVLDRTGMGNIDFAAGCMTTVGSLRRLGHALVSISGLASFRSRGRYARNADLHDRRSIRSDGLAR